MAEPMRVFLTFGYVHTSSFQIRVSKRFITLIPGLRLLLFYDDLHADAARLVLRLGHGEGVLHVGLKLLHTNLKKLKGILQRSFRNVSR